MPPALRHWALSCLAALLLHSAAVLAQPQEPAPDAAARPPVVHPPQVLRQVPAEYPEGARATGREGRVVLAVTVEADGSVGAVELMASSGDELDAAAIAAIRQWSFAPATRDGVAVAARIQVPFEFVLPKAAPEPLPSSVTPLVPPAAPLPAQAEPAPPAKLPPTILLH